jgi:hypothetical protein
VSWPVRQTTRVLRRRRAIRSAHAGRGCPGLPRSASLRTWCTCTCPGAADGVIAATPRDDPGRPGVGLALVLFAGELASAVRPDEFRGELPAGLVAACEQAVTAATLAAAACLAGLVEMAQLLSALAG